MRLQGHVATIIIIIRCMDRCARRFFQPFQGLPRLVISRLAVQGIRQVVVRRKGRAVLQESTPVIDIGLAPVFLAELAVSLPHFPPVRLGLRLGLDGWGDGRERDPHQHDILKAYLHINQTIAALRAAARPGPRGPAGPGRWQRNTYTVRRILQRRHC